MNPTTSSFPSGELEQKRHLHATPLRILVATDGSDSSDAAYAAAEMIAGSRGVRVHVLSVLEPMPPFVPPVGTPILATGLDRSREDALRMSMVEHLLKLGKLAKWTTEIRAGKPAPVIAKVAKEHKADLIIIGANRHGMVDRLLGEETLTQLARRVELPLLVASPLMSRLPKRAIVALDLSYTERTSFANALGLVGPPPSISVVHVEPRSEALGVDWAEYDNEYRAEVEAAFSELNEQLVRLPDVQPDLVVLHGDVAREINEYARSVKAEIVVLGVKRRRALSIAPGGGIAMKVARAAECSVLLVPSRA